MCAAASVRASVRACLPGYSGEPNERIARIDASGGGGARAPDQRRKQRVGTPQRETHADYNAREAHCGLRYVPDAFAAAAAARGSAQAALVPLEVAQRAGALL